MTDAALKNLFQDNFLEYASYVIKDRAIPDEADGLKPVQRRILWSLREMDDGRFNKVANVIGHCMRYHPHGDQSIGDALVSLANRGYFIETQGNFGNQLTGDEASAPRYIECRLTELAREVLLDDRLTEFIESYDGRNREPVSLPARLPVALLLGAEGIAVGMSTRILPHNFGEVVQAMISCIRGQDFSLYPDFPHGGSIDASACADGTGRIRNRATIERKKGLKKLVIREIPWGTTADSLIASIEAAARKGRVRISSIDDFTAGSVEIELSLARGAEPEETVAQLFAHTDCEVTWTSNGLVICGGRPLETSVSDLVHRSADRLLDIMRRQLELELADLGARLRWMTLEQIFIENRVYSGLEKAASEEAVASAVRTGMAPHLGDLELRDDDLEKLLAIRIRRISRFDIEAHRTEMGTIRAAMDESSRNLSDLAAFTVRWLQALAKKYGKRFPRRTRIEAFDDIDVKGVSLRNLKVGFDQKGGFAGTQVKGDVTFDASEYDRILAIFEDGTYKLLPMGDKHFLGKETVFCGIQDKDRLFTAVYREPEHRFCYCKRFRIESFILEKEYSLVPPGAELLLLSDRQGISLEFFFEKRRGARTRKGCVPAAGIAERSPSARGVRLGGTRIISSIRIVEQAAEAEPAAREAPAAPEDGGAAGGDALPAPGPPMPDAPSQDVDEILRNAEALRSKASDLLREASGLDQGDLFEQP